MAGMNAMVPDRIPQTQHDPGDPFASTESFEHEIRWHLEDEIRNEEDTCAESERGMRQTEVLVHLQRGKADVDAVEIRDKVAGNEERHEPPGNFRDGADFYSVHVTADW
jgi:hypothetical protein